MSVQTAAQALAETLTDDLRLHISVESKLEPEFVDRFSEERKMMWEAVGKPYGLWYAFGNDWMNWCLSEMEGWVRPYVYEVLVDHTKVKRITTLEEFQAFEQEYYFIPPSLRDIEERFYGEFPSIRQVSERSDRTLFGKIDWQRVREQFGGVEITPYQYKKRLSSTWYYGWDCASGCVWETAYKGVRLYAKYDAQKDKFVRV